MLRHGFSVVCAFSALLAATGVAPAATILDLSALSGGSAGTPLGVNGSGQVVGFTSGLSAFLYSGGTVVNNIGAQLGGGTTRAEAINNSGQIAAMLGNFTAPIYYTGGTGGTATQLQFSGGSLYGAAYGIDANGDVVGFAKPTTAGNVDALYYSSATSTLYDLPKPSGPGYDGYTYDTMADGISPNGTYVVGSADWEGTGTPPPTQSRRACYWTCSVNGSGVMTTSPATDLQALLALPAKSQVVAVNNSGQMFGFYGFSTEATTGCGAFYYQAGNSGYTSLSALGLKEGITGGKGLSSGNNLINSSGVVVGEETVSSVYHACIWNPSAPAVLTDLNTLYSSALSAWSAANGNQTIVLNDALAINDFGTIAGTATINGTASQVFVLTVPVPEPSTFLLAAMGLAGLSACAWKRRR